MLTRRSLLAASAASPVLSYAGGRRAEAATPKDVVVMGKQIDDMIALDPAQAYEFTDNELDGNIYRKLVMPDPKTGTTVIGDLAEKFEVSADGLTFTFHMRRDAKFDSGKPVTAQDAEFSFHRIVQMNKTPAFIITQFGFDKDNVAKLIRATDDTTLVMTLPAPQATSFVLFCISANVGGIVEKAAALEHQQDNDFGNAWLNNNSAGAGPFKLSSWKASDTVILDANPHAATPPGAKRVVIRHMKDPSTQLLSLQRGDIDIARNLGADQLKSLVGNANFHTVCSRNIEMTPLCKIEVTLPLVLGSREMRHGGGVDEQAGVRSARGAAGGAIRPAACCRCVRSDRLAATSGVSTAARHQTERCCEFAVDAPRQTQQPSAAGGGSYAGFVARARSVSRLWPDPGGGEAGDAARLLDLAGDVARLDDRGRAVDRSAAPPALPASAAPAARLPGRTGADRRLGARVVRGARRDVHPAGVRGRCDEPVDGAAFRCL